MSFLRQWLRPPARSSGDIAKDRLRLVLVHDRLNMPPDILENLKSDMIAVLSRYFDVDTNSLDVNVERGKRSRLITTITIKRNR